MGLTGGLLYLQEDYLQWGVFFRVSDSSVVWGSKFPWGVFKTPPCISHFLVISPLQACPNQPCLASNCWRNQNTRYGSCRHPVEKKSLHAHAQVWKRGRKKERKHIKGKTTFAAGWCVLDRRRHQRQLQWFTLWQAGISVIHGANQLGDTFPLPTTPLFLTVSCQEWECSKTGYRHTDHAAGADKCHPGGSERESRHC